MSKYRIQHCCGLVSCNYKVEDNRIINIYNGGKNEKHKNEKKEQKLTTKYD